jgi:NAD(P)-dependent dehydrogenase (short-subunit alcohol dehydrogenase family)
MNSDKGKQLFDEHFSYNNSGFGYINFRGSTELCHVINLVILKSFKMDTKKVWFVTGASKGLGLTLVKKILDNGYRVAATSRNAEVLISEVGSSSPDFLPLQVDLLNEQSISAAIDEVINTFGRIDIIVNNAGYGQLGTLEELTDKEARQNFDVNVFGSLNVIRKTMPHLRRQRSGHIFNISSIAGFSAGFPGWGIYCATKFAVAGFTEALAAEGEAFGIKATVVYPGYFRTNFLSKDSLNLPDSQIEDYKEARELQRIHLEEIKGNQPGDPEKAAAALIEVAASEHPPLHLFLGPDSYNMARDKIETILNELNINEAVGTSTDL